IAGDLDVTAGACARILAPAQFEQSVCSLRVFFPQAHHFLLDDAWQLYRHAQGFNGHNGRLAQKSVERMLARRARADVSDIVAPFALDILIDAPPLRGVADEITTHRRHPSSVPASIC